MAFSRNFGVNHAKDVTGLAESLVRRTQPSASALFLDFLELAENCSFLDRKLTCGLNETMDGHEIKA
jgi:hypothetical protein